MFYKFPKAVIDNIRRRNAYRQLDECVPLAFNYRSILSVQSHWSSVCWSVRPSVGRSVGRLVGRVGRSVGPHVRYFERNNIGRIRLAASYWARRPVRSAVPRIFMGAKVKLVAYRVHLLIKYLLTKGNT